jgi:outer membrane lipoprotein-sorting protein
MNDPFNYPYIDENASGYNSLTLVEFEGDEPVLFRMGNYQSEAVLGLIASIDTPTGPIIKIIFNKDGGLNGYWVGPNLDLEDNAFDQVNRVIASDMTKVSITSSQEDNYLYIVGYVQPGCLVLKSVNYLDADLSGTYAVGYNYVIDGPDDIADTIKYDTNQVIQYPDYLSGDFVKETRSTIICDNKTQWTYSKEINEVNIQHYKPKEGIMKLDDIFTMYNKGFVSKIGETVRELGRELTIIELAPKDKKKNYFKIKLYVEKNNQQIIKTIIFDKNGSVHTYNITNQIPNIKFEDGYFTFIPKKYPNVEINDMR